METGFGKRQIVADADTVGLWSYTILNRRFSWKINPRGIFCSWHNPVDHSLSHLTGYTQRG